MKKHQKKLFIQLVIFLEVFLFLFFFLAQDTCCPDSIWECMNSLQELTLWIMLALALLPVGYFGLVYLIKKEKKI